MATLVWDKVGERIYQVGVDHGVLYLQDGTAVPWNGLIDVEESSDSELKSFYLEGVKFLENLSPGIFRGNSKRLPIRMNSIQSMELPTFLRVWLTTSNLRKVSTCHIEQE